MHLMKQSHERVVLDFKKHYAQVTKDENGNPTHMLIFGDGMTKFAGATPKYGKRSSKTDSSLFSNRVFGVEVYCGPIAGEILIHTDETVRGGANLIIEIQRRGALIFLL